MASVRVQNLRRNFRGLRGEVIPAVDGIDLSIENREFFVLIGPSGCGKTTTLRLIAGLEKQTEGAISIDGRQVDHVAPKDRDVAMVFQNHALYPHMTARENMAFGLKARKLFPGEITRRIEETSSMLELQSCLDRLPSALSGGQRQRIALGRALVRKPAVLLFDEPLSNLDVQMRVEMRRELSRLHGQIGCMIIHVTHDQDEALALGKRVAVMKAGKIAQIADPLTLYRKPANLFVAGFVGTPAMNLFKGVVESRGDELWFREDSAGGFAVPLPPSSKNGLTASVGKTVCLALRPEDIAPCNANGHSDSIPVPATGLRTELAGSDCHLYAKSQGHNFIARAPADHKIIAGENLSFHFNINRAHLFDPETGAALFHFGD